MFANSSREELLHKPMPKGELLFDALTQETINKVQKTGLPYFHVTENLQIGESFGERFSNAIQAVFDKGFEQIITIGNDTPQLRTKHLLETELALEAGKTVLGPSLDGGFYLMGIHRCNFESETFKRLPWQRFSLMQRISVLLHSSNASLYKLPTLGDLDNLIDVKRLTSFIKTVSTRVLQALSLLVRLENGIADTFRDRCSAIYLHRSFNKGSPVQLHL